MSSTFRPDIEAAYREEGPRIWRSLVAVSHDEDVASDAVAEAFAQAIAGGDRIRDVRAWVWMAAFRIANGEAKRRSRETSEIEVPAEHYLAPEPVPEVVAALKRLSPPQRIAVVMADYADRPTDEIALALGIARATVHVHLYRARRRLRHLLGEADEE